MSLISFSEYEIKKKKQSTDISHSGFAQFKGILAVFSLIVFDAIRTKPLLFLSRNKLKNGGNETWVAPIWARQNENESPTF